MTRHSLAPLLCCLALAACATAPTDETTPLTQPARFARTSSGFDVQIESRSTAKIQSLQVAPQAAWNALPAVFQSLGIEAEVRDEASLTFGTQQYRGARITGVRTSDLVRCGAQGYAAPALGGYRVRLTVLARVQPAADGKADLLVEVDGTATAAGGTSSGTMVCSSTGKLEQMIIERVLLQAS